MSMEPKELYPGIYYLEKEIPNQTVKEPGYYWYNKKTFPTGIYIVRDRGEGRMISFGSYGVTVYPGKNQNGKDVERWNLLAPNLKPALSIEHQAELIVQALSDEKIHSSYVEKFVLDKWKNPSYLHRPSSVANRKRR